MIKPRRVLEKEFFTHVPKARKINPIYRGFFDINYKAHEAARPGKKLLNIYASWDLSGEREDFYREKFYNECDYTAIDFEEDRFIDKENPDKPRHQLPFPDESFDIIVTTKYIMEHISEPEAVVKEFRRVLKSGGEVFAIAPHIRRQHQPPWDFYRYTEYALRHLFTKAGFREVELIPTNGFMGVVGYYAYFFQRGLGGPKWIEHIFDWLHYWVIEPICYWLDKWDNGYGRDMTLYFSIRAKV
ncbi:MAG: class I SAM-dependent methyltransferase [Patescibacteria group bacterium]